jgi:Tol biopolymer transport system component
MEGLEGWRKSMQPLSECRSWRNILTVCFFVLLFLFDAVWCLKGVSMAAENKFHCTPVISTAIFSPDSDKIIFLNGCAGKEDTFSWAVYKISSKKIYDYKELNNATPHRLKYHPAFSRDGKFITFVSGQDNHRNLYIMNTDGTNVRQLTHDYNENPPDVIDNPAAANLTAVNITALKDNDYWARDNLHGMKHNEKPSFSPDGKKIIFVRSVAKHRYREGKGDPMKPLLWDVYEIEIETCTECKLTAYAFNSILSGPYYLSDGKRFVFSAGMWPWESGISHKDINYYERKYRENKIFIVDGTNNELRPAFTNGWYSDQPMVLPNDSILFRTRMNEKNNEVWTGPHTMTRPWHFSPFVYREGIIKRISNEFIYALSISPDGSRFIYSSAFGLAIYMNIDGTGQTQIRIPWEQIPRLNKYHPGYRNIKKEE